MDRKTPKNGLGKPTRTLLPDAFVCEGVRTATKTPKTLSFAERRSLVWRVLVGIWTARDRKSGRADRKRTTPGSGRGKHGRHEVVPMRQYGSGLG
jgi:hypothetical protein